MSLAAREIFTSRVLVFVHRFELLPLVTDHRSQHAYDAGQVVLGSHYGVNVFVGLGRFIAQALGHSVIEPYTVHLAFEFARGNCAPCLVARHCAAGAM